MSPVLLMWAHSRSASTAFVRMMLERGDVDVLHEPFLAVQQGAEVAVPAPGGGTAPARSHRELVQRLSEAEQDRPVFVKEVLDYRYEYVFGHPDELAGMTHTFLVRDPRQAISSHYAVKPTVTCPEIGYEWLWELFGLLREATGRPPLVLRAEDLLRDPVTTVRRYCEKSALPFRPESLHWLPGDRPEWDRHRPWHLDAIASTGFAPSGNRYPVTVDNDSRLKAFYDHHYPYYRLFVQHTRDAE